MSRSGNQAFVAGEGGGVVGSNDVPKNDCRGG